ncbi:MAG: DUF1152 domain-containing protein [Promethearchaeota archaeon]
MFQIPFFEEIKRARKVLIAGAGGGYDIYGGIPFYLALKAKGKQPFLASFSFTDIKKVNALEIGKYCTMITHSTKTPNSNFYFPEKYLASWFYEKKNMDVPVYLLHRVGPKLLRESYKLLLEALDFDTIVLVDGGTDALMKGDESGLGTPVEDATSIVALNSLSIERSYLLSIGFGVDDFHGVSHYDVLETLADFIKMGAFKGCFSLMKEMPEVRDYMGALSYANKCLKYQKSIVQNSIVSALHGDFGNIHVIEKTKASELFINPLMSQVWCLDLSQVCRRLMYASEISEETRLVRVSRIIDEFRDSIKIKKRCRIPL